MKKGKKWATNFGGGFTFDNSGPPFEVMFAGYPPFKPDYRGETDPCEQVAIELEHFKDILLWSDKHPPNFPQSIYSRNIFFAIIFESRAQADQFLKDTTLARFGEIDFSGEEFAETFGIDMKTGKMNKANIKRQDFGNFSFQFDFNLPQFNLEDPRKKNKKEISEELKNIRKSEKNLASYIAWTSEADGNIKICFRNEQEKANTLKALNLTAEYGGKYLWCHDVARVLGVELIPCDFEERGEYKSYDKKLMELVISEEELAKFRKNR